MRFPTTTGAVALVSTLFCCANGDSLFSKRGSLGIGGSATEGTAGLGPTAGGAGGSSEHGGSGGGPLPPICATEVTPSDTCNPVCDSCDAGNCRINCDGNGKSCAGETIGCPPGLTCNVGCANGGCEGTTVNCIDEFQCNLICDGDHSCRGANLNCAPRAVCKLMCQTGDDVCRDANVNCKDNWCLAECPSGASPVPTIACDAAGGCPCAGCEG